MNVSNPLIPSYLHNELGIADLGQLAFLSGLSGTVAPICAGLTGPFWGMLGDRFGRRNILVRAVSSAGVVIALYALVQNAAQLIAGRALLGMTGGVSSSTTALTASETPPRHLARALGIMSTARALGQTMGPATAGVLATFLPIRLLLVGAGAVVLVALAPVLITVRETQKPVRGAPRQSISAALCSIEPAKRRAILTTGVAQVLIFLGLAGAQQLILVRLVSLDAAGGAILSGMAFAALSVAAAVAGVLYPSLLRPLGHRGFAVIAVLTLAIAIVVAAAVTTTSALIAAAAFVGLGFGVSGPLTSSMLGLEAPPAVAGTLFGLGQSGQYLGMAVGSFSAGLLAAVLGAAPALGLIALAPAAGAAALMVWGREPPAMGGSR